MSGAHQTAWIMQAIRNENLKGFLQTSDRKPVGLPFRLQTENISMISFNKRMFHIPLAKQEALHSLEPKAC